MDPTLFDEIIRQKSLGNSLPLGDIEEAAELIDGALSVTIYAHGTSHNAGLYLQMLLDTQSVSSRLLYPDEAYPELIQGELVVCISQSGETPDVLARAKSAREQGIKLLSITNNPESALAQLSTLHLDLNLPPEEATPATATYTQTLLYCLFIALAMETNDEQKIPLDEFMLAIAHSLESWNTWAQGAAREWRHAHNLFCAGSHYEYGTAREAALKIGETTHIPNQAHTLSGSLHGPVVAINDYTAVLLFVGDKADAQRAQHLLDHVTTRTQLPIWVIGPQAKHLHGAQLGVTPDLGPEWAPLLNIIPVQLLAYYMAIERNLNPSKPGGLNKVTRTL
jgi:glucosamine--fructose-6-phosphate aminotransferase (isomerizing)